MIRLAYATHVRAVLPAVQAPALIVQRLDDRITPPCHGRYLAAHLPEPRYFEQPGSHLLWLGDADSLFAQIDELLWHLVHRLRHPPAARHARRLAGLRRSRRAPRCTLEKTDDPGSAAPWRDP